MNSLQSGKVPLTNHREWLSVSHHLHPINMETIGRLMAPARQIQPLRLFSRDVSNRLRGTIERALAQRLGRDPKWKRKTGAQSGLVNSLLRLLASHWSSIMPRIFGRITLCMHWKPNDQGRKMENMDVFKAATAWLKQQDCVHFPQLQGRLK